MVSGTQQPTLNEWIGCVLILIFPVLGTFFAPESYFAPQDFTIEAMSEVSFGFPYGRIGYLFVILWLVPQLVLNWQIMVPALRRSIVPLIFMLWTLASATWSTDPAGSINRSFRILVLVVFAIYLIERFHPKIVLRMLLISGSVAIICSIIAPIAIPTYGLTHLLGYEGAWRGATTHKNLLGSTMCLIFAVGYYSFKTRSMDRNWCVAVMLLSFFLIVMARSATSLLNVMISVVLFNALGFVNRLHQMSAKIIVLALAMIAGIGLYLGQGLLDLVLASVGRSSDFTGRSDIWTATWEMIQQKPILGWGAGFWMSDSPDREAVWDRLGWAPPTSHNTFLDVWFQLGFVGLVIVLVMLTIVFARTIRALLVGTEDYNLIWPLFVTTLLIGGLSESYLIGAGANSMFSLTLSYAALAKAQRSASLAEQGRVNKRRYAFGRSPLGPSVQRG